VVKPGRIMGYQYKPRRIRRAAALAAVMAVSSTMAASALDVGSLLAPVLTPATGEPTAAVAPLRAPANGYAAFATGTVLHAGTAGTVGAMVDLVSSTAAATSAPTGSATNSELGRVALPVLPARGSYGQGLGLGVGVGLLPGISTGLIGHAVAKAPPSSAPVESQAAPVGAAPIVHLTPLRAKAQALSSAAACVLGSNLASGQSNAADVSLVGLTALKGLSVGAPGGAGSALSRSESRTVIVPGSVPGRLGIMSETIQVLGPVTLLAGTANQTTVELKGEWVLRVTADGKTSSVTYSPQNVPGDQAAVLVRNAAGAVVASASAAQMKLAGSVGVRLDIPGAGEIVVGEQPRARGRSGAPQNTGTTAEAAVDLVRIRLLGQDVRLGHMEAAVAVPPAGITCPGLEVSITPATPTVTPGADFSAKVRVRNPNEGTVTGLTVASRMAADPGVTVHGGPASRENVVAPNGVGFKLTTPLGSGQSVELPARVHVDATSGSGRVRLGASATGRYGDGPLAVPAAGDVAVNGVAVEGGPAGQAVTPPPAPTTKVPAGAKAPVRTAASSKTGTRKPAGVSGAAGSAASAAPVAPAPTTSTTAPAPPPPPIEQAPPPVDPTPAAPPPAPPSKAESALRKRTSTDTDRRRYGWAGAAAVLAVAVAAAAATRLTGSRR
jgi:hypothetical protein